MERLEGEEMKCQQRKCNEEACMAYLWPGSPGWIKCCMECTNHAAGLANFLGFNLPVAHIVREQSMIESIETHDGEVAKGEDDY